MVPRGLWISKRRDRSHTVRRRLERGVLRAVPWSIELAASPARRGVPCSRRDRDRGGDDQCDSHDPLRIPTGRLATASEPLFGRECFDRGRRARRVFALRELPTQRIGWLGMDGSSFAPGWACARERGALHDGRWPPPRQRDVRHHAERSRRSLVFWRRCATGCDKSFRHAPDCGLRQRMVCLSDRIPGFSFAQSRRSARSRARGGRVGADGGDRLRDVRQGARSRSSRTGCESARAYPAIVPCNGRRARPCGSRTRRRNARLAVRARYLDRPPVWVGGYSTYA